MIISISEISHAHFLKNKSTAANISIQLTRSNRHTVFFFNRVNRTAWSESLYTPVRGDDTSLVVWYQTLICVHNLLWLAKRGLTVVGSKLNCSRKILTWIGDELQSFIGRQCSCYFIKVGHQRIEPNGEMAIFSWIKTQYFLRNEQRRCINVVAVIR